MQFDIDVVDTPDKAHVCRETPQHIEEWVAIHDGGFIRSAMTSNNNKLLMLSPDYVKKNVSWEPGTEGKLLQSTRKRAIGSLFTSEDSPLATANIRNAIRPAVFSRLPENDQARLLKLLPPGESITDALENPQIQEAIQIWQQSLANGQLDPEVVMQLKNCQKNSRRSSSKVIPMEQAFANAGYQYTEADGWHKRSKQTRSESANPTTKKRSRSSSEPNDAVFFSWGFRPPHGGVSPEVTSVPAATQDTLHADVSSAEVKDADDDSIDANELMQNCSHFKLKIRMWHKAKEAWLADKLPSEIASILDDAYPTDDEEEPSCFCGKLHVTKPNSFSVLQESWVDCDTCGKWCHTQCAGIGDDFDGAYICPRCYSSPKASRRPRSAAVAKRTAPVAKSTAPAIKGTKGTAAPATKRATSKKCSLECDMCHGAASFMGPLPVKLLHCYCGKQSRHILCHNPDYDVSQPMPLGYCCSAACRVFPGGKDLTRLTCDVCKTGPPLGMVDCCKCGYTRCHVECLKPGVSDDEFVCQECEDILANGDYDL